MSSTLLLTSSHTFNSPSALSYSLSFPVECYFCFLRVQKRAVFLGASQNVPWEAQDSLLCTPLATEPVAVPHLLRPSVPREPALGIKKPLW